jgi:hypothetical protein
MIKRIKSIFSKKEGKNWIFFRESSRSMTELEDVLESTFEIKNFVLSFIDIFFGILISIIIETPLLAIARYIRTFNWDFELDFKGFAVYLGLIFGLILIFYFVSKPLRKTIQEDLTRRKYYFTQKVISIVFVFLVIDVILEPINAISLLVSSGEWFFDIVLITDKIIASLILLFSILIVYLTLGLIKKRLK